VDFLVFKKDTPVKEPFRGAWRVGSDLRDHNFLGQVNRRME